jgi:transcriptional regulator with XRE-family HTH domain
VQDSSAPLPQLAVNVRTARKAAGLTQEQLARQLDVGMRSVQSWELSETMPRVRHLRALALLCSRELAWFYVEHSDDEDVAA